MDPKTTKAAHTITQAAAARAAAPPQHPQDDAIRHRRQRHIPLSLGKASLRLRLEAYYSLIAPATVSDRTVWLPIYDQIYDKVRCTLPCTLWQAVSKRIVSLFQNQGHLYTMRIVDWLVNERCWCFFYFWHVLITENWIELTCLPSIYRRTRLDFLILDTSMFLLTVVVVVVLRLILLSFLVWTMYVFIELFGGFWKLKWTTA